MGGVVACHYISTSRRDYHFHHSWGVGSGSNQLSCSLEIALSERIPHFLSHNPSQCIQKLVDLGYKRPKSCLKAGQI
jgi:hypothetical protein